MPHHRTPAWHLHVDVQHPRFSTFKREGVELVGSATLTIAAELRVGNVQETIRVTSETPIVDVQSVRREVVLQGDFVGVLPATRNYTALLNSIPALTVGFAISSEVPPEIQLFTARGGSANEGRVQIAGTTGGGCRWFQWWRCRASTYNTADATELQVVISGGLGENETGGPTYEFRAARRRQPVQRVRVYQQRRRMVPARRTSTLNWQSSVSHAVPRSERRGTGAAHHGGPSSVIGFGSTGRFATLAAIGFRRQGRLQTFSPGIPAIGDTRQILRLTLSLNAQQRDAYSGRLTAQLGKHRLSFSQENRVRCDGSTRTRDGYAAADLALIGLRWEHRRAFPGSSSPEAHAGYFPSPYYVTQATWTMPKTNRMLLEAGVSRYRHISLCSARRRRMESLT